VHSIRTPGLDVPAVYSNRLARYPPRLFADEKINGISDIFWLTETLKGIHFAYRIYLLL
jgi:hypothetical protein